MYSYKLSLTNSLEESPVHGHGLHAIAEYTDDDHLSLNPIQPLYSATPTPNSHAGSGAPIVHANWWVCCHCDSMNNPDLAPDRCSICQHYKCGACTITVV